MRPISQQDSISIRYIQGICIISVVLSHYPIRPLDVFWPFIFHMPMFFLLGGLLFKPKPILKTLKDVVVKHLFYLAYTFAIIAIIASYLANKYHFSAGPIYPQNILDIVTWSIDKNFHNNAFFLVAWFLFAYAIVSILCRLVLTIPSKIILFMIAICSGYIGMNIIAPLFKETKLQHWNLMSQVLVGCMFYIIGYVFKEILLSIKTLYIPVITVIVLFTLKSQKMLFGMGMSWSDYHPEFYLHMLSTSLCLLTIFVITNNLASIEKRYDLILTAGKYSKEIMSYHMLCFFVVDWVFFKFGMYDISKTRALNHFNTPLYWYCYAIAGVMLPIIFFALFRRTKKYFINKYHSNFA